MLNTIFTPNIKYFLIFYVYVFLLFPSNNKKKIQNNLKLKIWEKY